MSARRAAISKARTQAEARRLNPMVEFVWQGKDKRGVLMKGEQTAKNAGEQHAVELERIRTELAEQKKAVQEAAKRAQAYERQIMLADEQKLEAELKDKGMTFVDTDQSGFAKKAKESVLAAAKEELKPTIQKLYAD